MNKEQLIEALEKIKHDDGSIEEGHEHADDLILDYINDIDITKAFYDLERWYS